MSEAATPDPLAELRDIHLPPPIETWPPALGWWLLALLILAGIFFGLRFLYSRWQKNAYRREAKQQLHQLYEASQNDQQSFLLGFNALLKRVALTTFAREKVAHLTGESWVSFLDQTGNTHDFTMGPGQVLIDGQYAPISSVDTQHLFELGQKWISQHEALETA
jgi:hypothetical protein